MADNSDRGWGGVDPGALPPIEPQPTVELRQPRLTLLSYLLIGLMAVLWPIAAFVFLDSQMNMAQEVTAPIFEIYLPTIAMQLAILTLTLLAMRSEQAPLSDIGFRAWNRWTIPLAVGFLFAAGLTLSLVQNLVAGQAPHSFADFGSLLPKSGTERVTWVFLCIVVAISEEVIFRGYLITRVARLTGGRPWLGVLVATTSFAAGHLYQGIGGFVLIFVYGLMFAALFLRTGSLYPGIIAHFLQDFSVLFAPPPQ